MWSRETFERRVAALHRSPKSDRADRRRARSKRVGTQLRVAGQWRPGRRARGTVTEEEKAARAAASHAAMLARFARHHEALERIGRTFTETGSVPFDAGAPAIAIRQYLQVEGLAVRDVNGRLWRPDELPARLRETVRVPVR